MGFFTNLIPKRFRKKEETDKPAEYKNNVPKEKDTIKKSFAVYCNSHHDTKGEKLCPKCTALLATIFKKMSRCRYGITKPICDRCDNMCFGDANNKKFLEIMDASGKKMLMKHPVTAVKHKLTKWGVDYAKQKQNDDIAEKEESKRKAKAAKIRQREARKIQGKKRNDSKEPQ